MFVNSKQIKEELTITEAIAPVTGASASSSELVSMTGHTKFLAAVNVGEVTTAGNLVVAVYESTASAWASAVATQVTAARTTVSVATGESGIALVEVDADTLDKPYIGIHVANADAAEAVSAVFIRGGARYGNM